MKSFNLVVIEDVGFNFIVFLGYTSSLSPQLEKVPILWEELFAQWTREDNFLLFIQPHHRKCITCYSLNAQEFYYVETYSHDDELK